LINSEFSDRWERLVSGKVGLGCWALGGKDWGGQSEKASEAVLEEAWEAGYRHFDTAAVYGSAERMLGTFLKGKNEPVFVATKVFPGPQGTRIRESVQRSLERLQVSCLDLCYLHWPRSETLVEREVEVLAQCREEGLVTAIGVSNYTPEQLRRATRVAPISACQAPFNLIWRAAEKELIPECRKLGVKFVGYGVLAEGILGRETAFGKDFPQGDHRRKGWLFASENADCIKDFLSQMNGFRSVSDPGLEQLAIRWALQRDGVDAVLAGARRQGQATRNKLAERAAISSERLQHADALGVSLTRLWTGRSHYFGEHH
jgi:aryl-alcohol dehydrogenase-like predicted oxidoreductase